MSHAYPGINENSTSQAHTLNIHVAHFDRPNMRWDGQLNINIFNNLIYYVWRIKHIWLVLPGNGHLRSVFNESTACLLINKYIHRKPC